MTRDGVYTRAYLVPRLGGLVLAGMAMGAALVSILTPSCVAPTATPTPGPSYVIPTGDPTVADPTRSPSPALPPQEDDPEWDCRTQGNHVCTFQGELWLNVSHLPASLYARCLLGLGATGLSPEVASIDTEAVCAPLYVNG